MKHMMIALSCVGFVAVSCGKSDDSHPSGPNAVRADLGLVGASDFKNTAKNGQEVSAKLNQASNDTASVKFAKTPRYNGTSSEDMSILSTASVQSFLSERRNPFPTPTNPNTGGSKQKKPVNLTLKTGTNCGDDLNMLNSTYTNVSKGLRETASMLTQLDSQELGEGMTRLPADDKFAVSYSIDLSKVKQENASAQTEQSDVTLVGLALIGAGANETTAVLSTGIDATATGKDSTMTVKGGLVVSAETTQKLLKFGANADLNDNTKNGNAHGKIDAKMNLLAGNTPSISFELTATSNLVPATDGRGNGTLDDKDHTYAAKYSIERLANSDVAVTYTFTQDSDKQQGKVILTTDAQGTCVVKN